MSGLVEIYFDVVCPYAYLGMTQIERVAASAQARVAYKPMLLGGVLNAFELPDPNAAKARHNLLDMKRWADVFGVPLEMPLGHPRRTVLAMRAVVAAGDADFARAAHALFRAYWADGLDVAEPADVAGALDAAGLDGGALVAAADRSAIKDELRARTDEAIERGVFGAPTMFVGPEMFWGQDRLDFVERALAR